MKTLPCSARDVEFLSALGELTKPEVQFFRGGQCHGQLAKAAVLQTASEFLCSLSTGIENSLVDIGKAEVPAERFRLTGDLFAKVKVAGAHFGAKNYWSKRFVELVVLASRTCQECVDTALLDIRPSDVDGAASAWPVGPGTEVAARRIFTAVKSHQDVREVIRVLQRVLGGGKRRIPFISISAMLCFWKRNEDGSLNWHKPALQEDSAILRAEESLAAFLLQKRKGWTKLTSTDATKMVRNIHRAETVLNAFEVMADQRVVDVTEARNKRGGRVVTITKRPWDDIQSTPNASAFIKNFASAGTHSSSSRTTKTKDAEKNPEETASQPRCLS